MTLVVVYSIYFLHHGVVLLKPPNTISFDNNILFNTTCMLYYLLQFLRVYTKNSPPVSLNVNKTKNMKKMKKRNPSKNNIYYIPLFMGV